MDGSAENLGPEAQVRGFDPPCCHNGHRARVVAARLDLALSVMVLNTPAEAVVGPLGLAVVLESVSHHGCPIPGGCRMDRGLPFEMRGSRLVI